MAWLAQVDDLTRELGPDVGGEILYQLASHYRQSGQLALAADALDLLVDRFPAHPFTGDALLWLTLFYSSGEIDVHSARRDAQSGALSGLAKRRRGGRQRQRRDRIGDGCHGCGFFAIRGGAAAFGTPSGRYAS